MIADIRDCLDNVVDSIEGVLTGGRVAPLPSGPCFLYVFYSADRVLYVGISNNPGYRINGGHAGRRFKELAEAVVVRPFATRGDAEAAEALAIALWADGDANENIDRPSLERRPVSVHPDAVDAIAETRNRGRTFSSTADRLVRHHGWWRWTRFDGTFRRTA